MNLSAGAHTSSWEGEFLRGEEGGLDDTLLMGNRLSRPVWLKR